MSNVIKSFGTILKSNNHVKLQAKKYKQTKKIYEKMPEIPAEFNPIDTWGNFLQSIRNQGACGCCWAMATSACLNDRLTIMTLGQFTSEFSPYQMIMCEGAIPAPEKTADLEYIKMLNTLAHSKGACNGNSLYTAMDFMYCFGLVSDRCVNRGEFAKYKIKPLEQLQETEIPACQDILGKDTDVCMDRQVAARFYRIIAGYSVDSNIESIKQEIYKFGPVVSGFNVFNDFLNDYDGISIYMGPNEKSIEEGSQGGHAIRILGWGSEKVNDEIVPYWWIGNSWGVSWGLSGYFRMKMNIKECELETNVVAFIPDLPGFSLSYLLYEVTLDPEDIIKRSWFNVNQQTGYRYTAIDKIKKGKLKGNLDEPICKYTPEYKNTWYGQITQEDASEIYLKLEQYKKQDDYNPITVIFILLLAYLVGKGLRVVANKLAI